MRRYLILIPLAGLLACNSPSPVESELPFAREDSQRVNVTVPSGFAFETEEDVQVDVRLKTNADIPVEGAVVVFNRIDDDAWFEVRRRVTDDSGLISTALNMPKAGSRLGLVVRYPGFVDSTSYDLSSSRMAIELGGRQGASKGAGGGVSGKSGDWDSRGVPNYLEPQRDEIDAGLLATVNASLPEGYPVPDFNAQYLSGGDTDIHVTETADVWITFVHEGAGWKNALGYYTYPTGQPPSSPSDIASRDIVFPNVSYQGSGGGLQSGDKVHLGRFNPGTSIGWFIVSNGWKSNPPSVGRGNYTVYSNPDLNPEKDPSKRQHAILLSDVDRELMLIGFEDVNREWGWCDNDFNDAIFYVTATPFRAIASSNAGTVTDPGKDPVADADGDGVPNAEDMYPYEQDKAFVEYEPGRNVYGSLIFEDMWPNRGDYDFNDLVIDYNTAYVTDVSGMVSSMRAEFVLRAIGAGYRNGLGFELPISSSLVRSVNGQNLSMGYTRLNGNGTESGHSTAVIIAFENAYDVLPSVPGFFANTQPEAPGVGSESITIEIEFTSPQPRHRIGSAPYNIFLISGGERGREVHLPGGRPTNLANGSYLGSGDDASGLSLNYTSETGLPWAMHVPRSFAYPRENSPITHGHLKFKAWTESGGAQYGDWYLDKSGYRSQRELY